MACDSRFLNVRSLAVGAFLAAAIVSLPSVSLAGEGTYVRGDGTKMKIIVSDSEFGVTFREADPEQIGGAARRLASLGRGVVSDLAWAPGSRVKIVRVSEATAERRDRIGVEPEIESVTPVYRFEGSDWPMISTGSIVVRLRAELPDNERAAFFAAHDVVEDHKVEGLPRTYMVRANAGVDDELRCAESLAADPRTKWCQPNLIRRAELRQASGGVQDDFFSDEWHLRTIQAPEAWPIAAGLGVTVGMFDDSVDTTHPDLRNNYIGTGHDPTKPSNSADFEDPSPELFGDRHGTAVMGLIVAQANEIGVRGVSYLSKFTASRGAALDLSDAQRASVFTFAGQQAVDVHNNSWGLPGGQNPQIIVDAIRIAYEEGRDIDGPDGQGPRGMVILFAAGNEDTEVTLGSDLSSLQGVIGVGASNIEEQRASYSNFGRFINVLAPSGDGFLEAMVTTDNEDAARYAEAGYNRGGLDDFDFPEIDEDGDYTKGFSKDSTSAACAVASGVAALILSVNPQLTANDVRIIMEHTCDQIDPANAQYDGATSRSATYGYGRLNALRAVQAAETTKTNGNITWPERVSNPRIIGGEQLRWDQNIGTTGYLVVESLNPIAFIPQDGACYNSGQTGCSSQTILLLPAGVSIPFIGCFDDAGCAVVGGTHEVDFEPGGKKYFAIFGRNEVGRYSYGVKIDSEGNKQDDGPVIVEPIDTDPADNPSDVPTNRVAVTIMATPRAGTSPLLVAFNGNAVSDIPIDETQTAWDFDAADGILVDTRERFASHTYEMPAGQTRRFRARLTMVDMEGNTGTGEVEIFVDGGGSVPPTGGGGNDLKIIVGTESNPTANIDTGASPLNVVLSLDASSITGQLQSVFWDLGDGTSATSISVPHTYRNSSGEVQRVAVSATVTTKTTGNTTVSTVVSKLITITSTPATGPIDDGEGCVIPGSGNCNDNNGGTGAGCGGGGACGAMGVVMPLLGLLSLRLMRRRGV